MKKLTKYSLAMLLLIPNISPAIPYEKEYSHSQQLAINYTKAKIKTSKALKKLEEDLEEARYYEEVIERTGHPPVYKQKPVTFYQPSKKTLTLIDYPNQGVDAIINLEKNNITYELNEEIKQNIKKGKNKDFPALGWTTIKKGNKLKIIPPEREEEFLNKIYEKAKKEILNSK